MVEQPRTTISYTTINNKYTTITPTKTMPWHTTTPNDTTRIGKVYPILIDRS